MPEEAPAAQEAAGMKQLPWTSWAEYPKTIYNGREYAEIGKRLYTSHAVERMLPSGLTGGTVGRSISPTFVDEIIEKGTTSTAVRDGVTRTLHQLGTAEVITEEGGRIVVTVNPFKYNTP